MDNRYVEWVLAAPLLVTLGGCGRCDYDGPPLEYQDGAAAFSLIPYGRIGYVVHFEDEPGYVYPVLGSVCNVNTEDAVDYARKWRSGVVG